MRDYCVNLGRAPVTSETLLPLLREQGLVVSSGSADVPTAGCYLLFAKDAQRRFSHAVVSATIAGKKRTVFRGNLLKQRADLLAWLDDGDVNPVLRIRRRTTHEQKSAYPSRGLVELLVNLLVHRDYEIKEPSSIDVRPGMGITFGNPGALPEAVARQVQSDSDGRFQPVPKLSELRNRSLCDVFFGIRAMERQSTGLTDVCDLAKEHGGDATFTNDSRKSCFLAQVAQATASSASSFVARDDRHTGVYVLNILPFRLMPEHVSHVTLHAPMRLEQQRERLDGLGTLVHTGTDLWSFTPLERLLGRLGEVADGPKSRSRTVEQVLAPSETKTIIPWLLRKHFEWHLRRFTTQGLILEEGRRRGHRAYFAGCDGKPRTLIYDTPSRRGVKRQVVKQRFEGPAPWFENEGFGYEIVRLDGSWAIRIKPFYMFTGRDARKPLPAFARTSRATRRMKFDRNKNVEDDLTFWGRFLSAGAATINLGAPHVADLIVDGSFLTIEVPEEGLLDENTNRMPA
jgi:hypothetical protein